MRTKLHIKKEDRAKIINNIRTSKHLEKFETNEIFCDFPKRIKEYREKYGYTQEMVANMIGISLRQYVDYEKEDNITLPSVNNLGKLAEIYSVSIDNLLGRTDYISDEQENAGNLLGLSPSSIQYLHSNRHEIYTGTLDYLLTNHYGDFSYLLLCFTNCLSSFNRINVAAEKFGGKLEQTEIDTMQKEEKETSDAAILEMLHILQLIRDTAIYDAYSDNKIKHKLLYEQLKNEEK